MLVLGVGLAIVGALGFALIARDGDARRSESHDARQSLADRWASELSSSYQNSASSVRRDPSQANRTLWHHRDYGLSPMRALASAASDEEQTLFDRSRRGGDAYVARGDLSRAVDAYSFAMPELTDRNLKDRLLLRIGRASITRAASGGDSAAADRALGERILRELATRPSVAQEGSFPVEFLARLALASGGDLSYLPTRAELAERFDSLPFAVVETLALRQPFSASDELARRLERDRALSEVIQLHATRLRDGRSVLLRRSTQDTLVVPVESGEEVLALALVDRPTVDPTADSAEYAAYHSTVEVLSPVDPAADVSTSDTARARVELDGEPIAEVRIVDPRYADTMVAIARRETGLRVGLVAVLLVIGVALLTTWAAIDRQRRLAELKVRLLANVSHELKTPVTSIRMLGELLADPKMPREKTQDFGRLVTREARRLGRRIEDILETAQGADERQPLERTPLDVARLTREVVDGFSNRAEDRGVDVRFESCEEPLVFPINQDAVERIVENLVDNAMKYGLPPDGDTAAKVVVSIERTDSAVHIHVDDRGPGVAAEERERIFDSFYRVAFQNYGVPGTGLGLAISRSLARRMGGTLDYSRRPEGGSRFTLSMTGGARSGEGATPSQSRETKDPFLSSTDRRRKTRRNA